MKDLKDPSVIAIWRREFPILESTIHLGNCSQSPQARRVREAVETYLNNWLTVGMDWDYWMAEVTRAKAEFARLIGAEVDDIAVSTSVSEAIAGVASSLDYTERKKVVTTEAEFPTVGQVWLAHQRFGPSVEFVPVRDGELFLEDYDSLIDHNTACVSVTHVYYQNGFRQDIAAITRLAHERGALVCIDDYQSCGTYPIDVKALDVDFLTSGNLKYLLGVPGIAFLYVKRAIVDRMKPAVTGWFGQEDPFSFKVKELKYAGSARRYDTGTPAVMPAFAARAGMEIINEVGTEGICERIEYLSQYTLDATLRAGFEVTSPMDVRKKGSTTSMRVPDPHAIEGALKARGIIASARGDVIRFAPHFFTTEEDIDTAVAALAEILGKK